MTTIDEQKSALRQAVRAMKKQLPEEKRLEKSRAIWEQLEQLPEIQQAKTIMLYWSMNDEVDTHDLVIRWASKKRIILPAVDGNSLILKKFTGLSDMTSGDRFGILEPMGSDFVAINEIDLIIVPGVAFDRQQHRMGRGKAYYDKTLRDSTAVKIGICFDFQLFDEIPTDEFDVAMDKVIFG